MIKIEKIYSGILTRDFISELMKFLKEENDQTNDIRKYVYDLNLAYDLSKEPQEYLKDIGVDLISSYIDSSGCGCFEKNETDEYVGSFGWFDGVACITIWDIFQEDIYSVLKQYIKEEKVNESILSEFEI